MAPVYSKTDKQLMNTFQTKQSQDFFSSLNEMRNYGINTDVVLVCEDEEVKAHRLVLSTASPYFKIMFEKDSSKTKIDLPHINKHTLNAVVNFLYMSSKYDISRETFQSLLDIHELSHVFKLDNLIELTWSLIMERMNVANCLVIWKRALLFSEPPEIKKVFLFILNNLPSVVHQKAFFNLEISHLKLLLQKINDKNFRTGDYLLEAVVRWMKIEKKRVNFLVDLFFCFNFDFISDDKMKEVFADEDSSFQNEFFKLLLQLQVTPNLKLKKVLEEVLKNSQSQLSNENIPPVLFFYFGSYKHYLANGKLGEELPAVWVVDVQNKSNVSFKLLPFTVNDKFLYAYCDSCFYFLEMNSSGTQSNHFFCYNWKTNDIISKPSPPEILTQSQMCSCSSRIYLIGIKSSGYIGILYFDISKQQWITISFYTTYTFCNLYSVISNSNHVNFFTYSDSPGYSLFSVDGNSVSLKYSKLPYQPSEMQCIHNNVVYDFINPLSASCTVYVHKPPDQYKTLTAVCNEPSSEKCCFSTESGGIFFYSNNNKIYHFDPNVNKIVKLPFHYPFTESTQVINNKICSFGFEILIVCEKQNDAAPA